MPSPRGGLVGLGAKGPGNFQCFFFFFAVFEAGSVLGQNINSKGPGLNIAPFHKNEPWDYFFLLILSIAFIFFPFPPSFIHWGIFLITAWKAIKPGLLKADQRWLVKVHLVKCSSWGSQLMHKYLTKLSPLSLSIAGV